MEYHGMELHLMGKRCIKCGMLNMKCAKKCIHCKSRLTLRTAERVWVESEEKSDITV